MTETIHIPEIFKKHFPYAEKRELKLISNILNNVVGAKSEDAISKLLQPSTKHFNHPFLMKDLEKAADLIIETIDSGGKILFWGDYDADGVTTIALFVKVLRDLGYDSDWIASDRHKGGYGIDKEILKGLEDKYDLIVTGDVGIKEIETLGEVKTKVIVTDHHEPIVTKQLSELDKYEAFAEKIKNDDEWMAIPNVEAVVNPKRIDCKYPNKCLSGVAVVFKLFQGIFIKKNLEQKQLLHYLDIVSVGLVADVMDQFDKKNQNSEVHLMTSIGIQLMNQFSSTWVNSLRSISNKASFTYNDLGFFIGPRLNAPGRLGSADIAVEFLLENDPELSLELASDLERINEERKKLQEEGVKSAKDQIGTVMENIIVIKMDNKYHSGIAGLIAGDLSRKFNCPTIVLCEKEVNGELFLTGSCRSIPGVNILELLIKTEKQIGSYKFGGHAEAAGLTLKNSDLDKFKRTIEILARNIDLNEKQDEIKYDLELSLDALSLRIVELIQKLHLNVTFLSKNNEVFSAPTPHKKNANWCTIGIEKNGVRYQPFCFNQGAELVAKFIDKPFKSIDVVYSASIFNGKPSILIDDFKL